MNSFVIKNPIIPQPGKVRIQVITISLTTLRFTEEKRFAAPTPIIEVVFAWVVDTGIPNTELNKSEAEAARSAEKP